MIEALIFFLGFLLGTMSVYFAMRNQRTLCELHGVAAHIEKQQAEKQSRKERIIQIIKEKGTVANNDIEKALGVTDTTATNYLQELEREGKIEQIGERGRFVSYKLKGKL